MDFERALETQRLRLLRVVAGLALLLGFLTVGPVSRDFSVWTYRFVGSILSRAEAAARYLVIAQARMMLEQSGVSVTQNQLTACLDRVFVTDENDVSLADGQRRLRVLRTLLKDLSSAAYRLLRRIEKHAKRTGIRAALPFPLSRLQAALRDWQLTSARNERPPDKTI